MGLLALGAVATAAIGAGASLASSAASNVTNAKVAKGTNETNLQIAQETNQTNRELAEQQNEWNKEQWERENAYNSPAEQVKRLKEAGLSDAAASQAIEGAGNAGSIQSADLANQQIGAPMIPYQFDFSALDNITRFIRDALSVKKESAEADMAEKQNDMTEPFLLTDYDLKQYEVKLKALEFKKTLEAYPYSLRALRSRARQEEQHELLNSAQLDMLKVQKEEVNWRVRLAKQEFGWLNKLHGKELEKMTEEIKNVLEQRKVLRTQSVLNQANIEQTNAATENLKEQKEGISQENANKKIQTILALHGAPESCAERCGALIAEGILQPEKLYKTFSGTQDYVREGNKWFGADPYTRDFLFYYWDQGKAAGSKLGLYSMGFLHELDATLRHQQGR